MNLIKIKNSSYYVSGPTNTGVIMLSDNNCVLIDTSYPGKLAEQLLYLLKDNNLNVKYIINTHGHIDHFGANELLSKHFSLAVFASSYEKSFISYPDLSHGFLTSAKPIPELETNLEGLEVNEINKEYLDLDNTRFKIIELPGHSRGHIGIITESGVLFAGDALLGPDIIDKVKIPYFYDIEKFNNSLHKIKNLVINNKVKKIIPAHGEIIINDFEKAINLNIEKVKSLLNTLLDILSERPLSLEKIIISFNRKYDIHDGIPNHFITRACIMSFLSYLIDKRKVKTIFKNNLLHYELQ